MKVLGAVLAGGRSSRFGSDKALAALNGRALLDHAVAALGPQVDAVVVVGRAHPDLLSVPDRPTPDLGPLGGLCGALRRALNGGYGVVVTVGCDTPLLPGDLVERLAGEGAAVAADCPVVGWWPAALSLELDAHLAADGSRAVRRWAERVGARRVALDRPLANVNTPAELDRLIAERRDGQGSTHRHRSGEPALFRHPGLDPG